MEFYLVGPIFSNFLKQALWSVLRKLESDSLMIGSDICVFKSWSLWLCEQEVSRANDHHCQGLARARAGAGTNIISKS